MRLRNHTDYDTRALRRVAAFVNRYGEALSKDRWRLLIIDVEYARTPDWAWEQHSPVHVTWRVSKHGLELVHMHGHRVLTGKASPLEAPDIRGLSVDDAINLAADSLAKLAGRTRLVISAARWDRLLKEVGEYVPTTPPKPVAKPTKAELQRGRYERVLEAEQRWTRKLKLAKTKLKKLRIKRRYYEKELACEQ